MMSNLSSLNDTLAEAMLLLDPPYLNRPSTLTVKHVTRAHDLLIPAVGCINIASLSRNYTDEDFSEKETSEINLISVVSDTLRALILSSSLLLEMCPWQEQNSTAPLSHENYFLTWQDVEKLYQTTRQSILLLQLMSHYTYLSHARQYNDWHDELLPKSQYPLLQECFQRKEMMDVEENLIFGFEDRLTSLEYEDYLYCEKDFHDMSSHTDGFEQEHEIIADDAELYQAIFSKEMDVSDTTDNTIPLSFDPKILIKEEESLLDIALPEDRPGSQLHRHRKMLHSDKAQDDMENSMGSTTLSLFFHEKLIKDGIGPFVESPLHQCCILKQGWLVLKRECVILSGGTVLRESTSCTKCYIYLFSNGFIPIYSQNTSAASPCDSTVINGFSLTLSSKTRATTMGCIFHFVIDNLIERNAKVQDCIDEGNNSSRISTITSITLGVDEDEGGSLAQGVRWMMAIDECIKNMTELNQIHQAISHEWCN
uniref:Uncharacterized protein n=1 Tax=Chaetoceros debilis TaxID=122233 RepID=A0A7S3V4H2_9STRA|mmetsp:Transcript_23333/g.35483  ORF Transcript_23333/g.35483 Transcript_23333/m.35483 type:complete len:482 (+) Transcript_23333:24-1469(+)